MDLLAKAQQTALTQAAGNALLASCNLKVANQRLTSLLRALDIDTPAKMEAFIVENQENISPFDIIVQRDIFN